VKQALRLTRDNGADLGFAFDALISGAISVSEFIGWTERVILQSEDALPDYIYEVASLNQKTAIVSDLYKLIPATEEPSKEEQEILSAISVIRNPKIIETSDESRPSTPKKAKKIIERHPHAFARFKAFFPAVII